MLTDEHINEIAERSKNDRAIIVGSEIRQLCDQAKAANRDEWVLMGPAIVKRADSEFAPQVRLEAGDVVILRGEER